MSTQTKIDSNRRNASKSTGPKTPAGKSATSMNALRNGLWARQIVLPGESQEEFDRLHAGYQDKYDPQDAVAQDLVDMAVVARWKMARAEAVEARCCIDKPSADDCAAIMGRMAQVHSRFERAFFKAYNELERIKAAREKAAEKANREEDSESGRARPGKPKIPKRMTVSFVNPETGESKIIDRIQDGKLVEEFTWDDDDPPPPGTVL